MGQKYQNCCQDELIEIHVFIILSILHSDLCKHWGPFWYSVLDVCWLSFLWVTTHSWNVSSDHLANLIAHIKVNRFNFCPQFQVLISPFIVIRKPSVNALPQHLSVRVIGTNLSYLGNATWIYWAGTVATDVNKWNWIKFRVRTMSRRTAAKKFTASHRWWFRKITI